MWMRRRTARRRGTSAWRWCARAGCEGSGTWRGDADGDAACGRVPRPRPQSPRPLDIRQTDALPLAQGFGGVQVIVPAELVAMKVISLVQRAGRPKAGTDSRRRPAHSLGLPGAQVRAGPRHREAKGHERSRGCALPVARDRRGPHRARRGRGLLTGFIGHRVARAEAAKRRRNRAVVVGMSHAGGCRSLAER